MAFMGILAMLAAAGVPGIAHLTIRQVRPGRIGYVAVRLLLSAFIILEMVCARVVFELSAAYDGVMVDIAPVVYVIVLIGVLIQDAPHMKFHLLFSAMLRKQPFPVKHSVIQVTELVCQYAMLYREIKLTTVESGVYFDVTDDRVAYFALDAQATTDTLFYALGRECLGRYDWPRSDDIVQVTVIYLGDGRWELDDGEGPVGFQPTQRHAD